MAKYSKLKSFCGNLLLMSTTMVLVAAAMFFTSPPDTKWMYSFSAAMCAAATALLYALYVRLEERSWLEISTF